MKTEETICSVMRRVKGEIPRIGFLIFILITVTKQAVDFRSNSSSSCYVCLPPDKTSQDAEDILSIFPQEVQQQIPDCAMFDSENANMFEFTCPLEYVGCLLKTQGNNVLRTCGMFLLDDCITVNLVEVCYCTGPLCNGNQTEIPLDISESIEHPVLHDEEEQEIENTTKIWRNSETDDEDLLGRPTPSDDSMQDETSDIGSGNSELFITTHKPTIIYKCTNGAYGLVGLGLCNIILTITILLEGMN